MSQKWKRDHDRRGPPGLPPGGTVLNVPQEETFQLECDPAAPGELAFEPYGSKLAVRVYRQDTTTSGLKLVGAGADEYRTPRALVLAVGPEVRHVKVGDVVFFPPSTIAERIVRDTGYFLVVKEESVAGKDLRPRGPEAAGG